jgi:hypothetical protein
MDVSRSEFYSDIYSSQLKMYIVKFNMHEYNITTKYIINQSGLNESILLIISNIEVN